MYSQFMMHGQTDIKFHSVLPAFYLLGFV